MTRAQQTQKEPLFQDAKGQWKNCFAPLVLNRLLLIPCCHWPPIAKAV